MNFSLVRPLTGRSSILIAATFALLGAGQAHAGLVTIDFNAYPGR